MSADGTLHDGPSWACAISLSERAACGDQNDPNECVAAGCCWSPTGDATQPDLFFCGRRGLEVVFGVFGCDEGIDWIVRPEILFFCYLGDLLFRVDEGPMFLVVCTLLDPFG